MIITLQYVFIPPPSQLCPKINASSDCIIKLEFLGELYPWRSWGTFFCGFDRTEGLFLRGY